MSQETLFHEALATPPDQRAAYLDAACAGQPQLRADIEALLAASEDTGNPLDRPPPGVRPNIDHDTPLDPLGPTTLYQPPVEPGLVIAGRYSLIHQIGEGGMAAVWLAQQTEPIKRKVALKLIKASMNSKAVLSRFEQERQALALMDHPNIARVLDGGLTPDGRPFFVMDLVNGLALNRFCDQERMSLRQRLELFVPICQAVQHAHQKGIIHRDLKPGNILVTTVDGKPVPKVIDFGLAKATAGRLIEDLPVTQHGTMLGTLEYMAPEQSGYDGADIDTRADIYSLGVILYELLTGLRPFDANRLREAAWPEMIRILREDEPPLPSLRLRSAGDLPRIAAARRTEPARLSRLLRGEIDWIVIRCLEKDRSRRYETASALARDVERYLRDEAVEACPPSVVYRLRKFVRKYRVSAAVFCLSLAVAIVASVGYIQTKLALTAAATAEQKAEDEAARATAEAEQSARQAYAANLNLIQRAWDVNQVDHVRSLLAQTESYPDRGFEWYYWQRLCHLDLHTLIGHSTNVRAVSWSPDGQWLATASDDRTVKIWSAHGGAALLTLTGHTGDVNSVSWSPDGQWLATASVDETAKIWSAQGGAALLTLTGHTGGVNSVSWSPDGQRLATASDDRAAKIWSAQGGAAVETLKGHTYGVVSVSWSPDGRRLATASWDGTAKIWSAQGGTALLTLNEHTSGVLSVSWSPDSQRLATAGFDMTAKIWSVQGGAALRTLKEHIGVVHSVSWSADGQRLATASFDMTAKIWSAREDAALLTIKGHTDAVNSVSWSPDGQWLATASWDGTTKVWSAMDQREVVTLKGTPGGIASLAWSPDRHKLAWGHENGTVTVMDARNQRRLLALAGHKSRVTSLAWSQDGALLVTADEDRTAKMWDVAEGRELLRFNARQVSWSPDGKWLAVINSGGTAEIWDPIARQSVRMLHGHDSVVTALAWARDGRLATCSLDGRAKVWNVGDGKELVSLDGSTGGVSSLGFSPDNERLAIGNRDGRMKIWDVTQAQERLSFKTRGVYSLSWSPDGKRLATTSSGSLAARVWDTLSGRELLGLPGRFPAWSPDGEHLATALPDGTVKVWATASIEAVLEWAREDRTLADILVKNTLRDPRARGFIKSWLLLLPIPLEAGATGAQGLDRQQIANEAQLRPRFGNREPVGDRKLDWLEYRSSDAVLDFNAVLGREETPRSIAYAVCYLESAKARKDVWLKICSDDQAKVYLNGSEVYQYRFPRGVLVFDTIGPVALQQGTNVLVFKVVNEKESWKGCVRLVDEAGQPVQGIRVKLNPEPR